MNLIQTEGEIKNSTILFLILGVFLVPVINSIESILFETPKLIFDILPIKTLAIFSIIFHSLILLAVIALLFRLLQKTQTPILTLSLKTFRITGFIFVILMLISAIINLYTKTYLKEAIDLSKVEYIDTIDLAYLTMISGGLITFRKIILFVILFVIIFKGQKQYRQQNL